MSRGHDAGPQAVETAFDVEQREGAQQNPPGVTFTIAFEGGAARFRVGEPIRIELSFSSSVPDKYRLDGALYDRSGRLDLDTYRLEPEGDAVDPLADYFEAGVGIMGGLRSVPVLGAKPEKLVFALNEWRRIDKPGHYRLFVRSSRIQREKEALEDAGSGATVTETATSNLLTFEVVPADAAWAADQARTAVEILDGGGGEDARRSAARDLRFLGTEAAAQAMAQRFQGSEVDFDLMFGLVGSPHRAPAVAAMEKNLAAPDFPVTSMFLDTLSLLRAKLDAPASRARRGEKHAAYSASLAASVAGKRPRARATTIATLLEIAWRTPRGEAPPPWLATIDRELPSVFSDLPGAMQSTLLAHRFRRIASPAMVPVLRALYERPSTAPDLRMYALLRLHELAPDEGRPLLLAAIQSAAPPLGVLAMQALGALPDATLPDLDDALAGNLTACAANCSLDDLSLRARLVARYATARVLPRVKAAWARAGEAYALDIRAAFMAYFLRTDPPFGEQIARQAIAGANNPGSRRLLADVAELHFSPELEKVLLEALDSPDPELAAAAATALGKHGSAAAEAGLWRRLERWHAVWQGRARELRYRLVEKNPNQTELALESALWRAIATGAGWIAGGDKLERLSKLLVSEQEKEQLGHKMGEWRGAQIAIRMHRLDGGDVHASVAQYDAESLARLRDKLSQFPRGTTFVWQASMDLPVDFAQIKQFVEERGMKLER